MPLVTKYLKRKPKSPLDRLIAEGQQQSLTTKGEEDKVILVQWLNAAAGSKSYGRVSQLVEIVQATEEARVEAVRDGVYVQPFKPGETGNPEKRRRAKHVSKLQRLVDQALLRYTFHPRLTGVLYGQSLWRFDLVGDEVVGDFELTLNYGRRVYEADAAFGIARLASWGYLDRLRKCLSCQRWLYASPVHKKFCDTKCQLKYFSTIPEQKQKRAAYMREYRRKEKERQQCEDRMFRPQSRKRT